MPEHIIGKYRLVKEVGRGPLGKAFEAVCIEDIPDAQLQTGDTVVLRGFTRPAKADAEHWSQCIERLNAEAMTARKLSHRNIAKLHDCGVDPGEIYYVATQFFVGTTFRKLIDRKGKEDFVRLMPSLVQICSAMDYANKMGISHTDLTPFNILLEEDGQIKIINYGLGHVRNKRGSEYQSPEQVAGAPGDLRSDLFSLGIILYELLSGQKPFTGADAQELGQSIQEKKPEEIPNLPDYVQGVLLKMLAKDPATRYEEAGEVIADLRNEVIPEGFHPRHGHALAATRSTWEAYTGTAAPSLGEYRLNKNDLRRIKAKVRESKRAKRAKVWEVAIGLGWVALFSLLVYFVYDSFHIPQRESAIQVTPLGGSCNVIDGKTGKSTPLANETTIQAGTTIRTSGGSSALLRLFDGSRIKLGERTLLMIRDVGYHEQTGKRESSFELQKGITWIRVQPSHKTAFQITTGKTAYRVKGTAFYLNSSGNASTLAVLEGTVGANVGDNEQNAQAGQHLSVSDDQIMSQPKNITDDQKKALLKDMTDLLTAPNFEEKMQKMVADLQEATVFKLASRFMATNKGQMKKTGNLLQAITTMGAICKALEMTPDGSYPESLNLQTLEELGMNKEDVSKWLANFDGQKLLSYQRSGDGYEFTARVADDKKTLIQAKNGQVKVVEEKGGGSQ